MTVRGIVLSIVVPSLLVGCTHPRTTVTSQTSAAPATSLPPGEPGPSASPGKQPVATPSQVKITVHGSKVGSRYIYVTKQKDDRKVYVLRADSESGEYFGSDTGRSDFVNPHVTFFGKGDQRLVADAPSGTAVEKDKTIVMSGGVQARTADGKTLRSDTLRYDDQTDMLYGNGNVVVNSPSGDRLEGDQLRWNLHTGHMDFTGAR